MALVTIKCPATSRAVSTGIDMSTLRELEELPLVTATMQCPRLRACPSVDQA